MLLLFAKRCIILSAMSGISKRNTSGLRDRAAHLFANPVPPSPSEVRLSFSRAISLFICLSVPPSLSRTSLAMHYLMLPLLQELHHNWPTLHVTGMHDLQITRKSPDAPKATPRSAPYCYKRSPRWWRFACSRYIDIAMMLRDFFYLEHFSVVSIFLSSNLKILIAQIERYLNV